MIDTSKNKFAAFFMGTPLNLAKNGSIAGFTMFFGKNISKV
jgi:hypothetical protein